MASIIRSADSLLDIDIIWNYIAIDNVAAADKFVRTIDEWLLRLADNPLLGRARDEFHPALRSVPIGSYLLFYRPIDNGVELVRVLHGAREQKDLLGG